VTFLSSLRLKGSVCADFRRAPGPPLGLWMGRLWGPL